MAVRYAVKCSIMSTERPLTGTRAHLRRGGMM